MSGCPRSLALGDLGKHEPQPSVFTISHPTGSCWVPRPSSAWAGGGGWPGSWDVSHPQMSGCPRSLALGDLGKHAAALFAGQRDRGYSRPPFFCQEGKFYKSLNSNSLTSLLLCMLIPSLGAHWYQHCQIGLGEIMPPVYSTQNGGWPGSWDASHPQMSGCPRSLALGDLGKHAATLFADQRDCGYSRPPFLSRG